MDKIKIIKETLKKVDINYDWFMNQKSYLAGFTQQLIKQTLKLQQEKILEIIDGWLDEYCTHGKDVCEECIKELKQKIKTESKKEVSR